MPRIHLIDFRRGLNKVFPPHLLQIDECSELSDVSFRNGKWQKRVGYTLPYSATGDAFNILDITDFQKKDGTFALYAFTKDGGWRLNGTVWVQDLNLTTTRADTDKWFFGEISNNFYATNGVDTIRFEDTIGSGFTAVTWDTSVIAGKTGVTLNKAKILLPYNNRILFFNTDDSLNGVQPTFMMYTEVNDFDRIVGSTNFANLDWSHAPIISAGKLGNNRIAAYKSDSVAVIQDVGAPTFFIPRFADNIGILAPKAWTHMPGGHFFVSNQGFFQLVSGGVQAIGDDRIVSYFFDNLSTVANAKDHIYCFTDRRNRELHTRYPATGATEPNRDLIYNWQYDNWCEWILSGFCGFEQYRTLTTPLIFLGSSSGNVRQLGGTTDNGAAINSKIHSKAFVIAPHEKVPDTQDIMSVIRLETDASPTTATMKIGAADRAADAPTFTTATITDTVGKAPLADMAPVFGRYITLGAENFTTISEIIADWEEAGKE